MLRISPIGRDQLAKMLITHGIFGSNAYLNILTLSSYWYAKW